MMKKKLIVGASGASGMPVLVKCLKLIRESGDFETTLIMTESAKLTFHQEMAGVMSEDELAALADHIADVKNIGDKPASGSYRTEGMLIVPCSMKTIAGIRSGYSDNLLLRAADVTLKEQRTLVLAARETPLNAIHLRNMQELAMIPGIHIVPPMMTFYHSPKTIDDMVYHTAARLVEIFGVQAKEYRRWSGI